MRDSISRENALNAFGLSEKTRKYGGDHSGYNTMMLYEIQDILEELPSAEPEIIRCKDCKYFDKYKTVPEMYQWDAFCLEWARNTYENWFCSRAKRKCDD